MGPVSGVNERQTDPYLQWSKQIEKNASEAGMKRAEEKTQDSQDVKEKEKENNPAESAGNVPARRTRDEYIPETKGDADSKRVKNEKSEKPDMYRASTDKVDREIEKLKKQKAELEGKLSTEKDERKIQELERQLSQVERELSQKDNDTYRKQHMEMTKL